MKKYLVVTLTLVLVLILALTVMACKPEEEIIDDDPDPTVSANETTPLVLQTSEFDGVFNPFFYSSAYDGEVVGLVNASLLTVSADGQIVAGDQYATVAKSYTITPDENDGSATYEFVIKNGLKFSDGTAITADDVLFNMYVYLDPKYDGSSTMYTLPIEGLTEYRNQVTPEIATEYGAIADAIFAIGEVEDYVVTGDDIAAGVTQELYDAYWTYLDVAGVSFTQEIVNYVMANYGSDGYVKEYFHPALTYGQIAENPGLVIAFGMGMWGYGEFPETVTEDPEGAFVYFEDTYELYDAENPEHADYTLEDAIYSLEGEDYVVNYDDFGMPVQGEYIKTQSEGYFDYDAEEHAGLTRYNVSIAFESATTETLWTMEGEDKPTVEDYWAEIRETYGTDYSEEAGINYESAGTLIQVYLKELFISGEGSKEVEGGGISSISGITKGTKDVEGVTYETITVKTTSQSPKTILQMGITVTPKAYYTAGYTYDETKMNNAGAELNSPAFIAHLKTKNSTPVGAGPYKFIEFQDNIVYFERNEQFASFGLGNAKIKFVRMKVISGGQEYDAVKSGEVHYATVSATSDVVNEVSTIEKLTAVLVDNLGYGYICVNPKFYPTIEARAALQTLFNLDLVAEYYPSGLAEVIHRAMSKVSWAYPEGSESLNPYDATGATARTLFAEAGYTWQGEGEEEVMIDPATSAQAEFVFTIPSGAADHPAGQIFIRAKEMLDDMGAIARVNVDPNLIANIKKPAGVGVYALAWQAALDPDMYQVYHIESQASSVTSNGIKWLYTNGDETQKAMLEELADLIDEAVTYMNPAERAPIYEEALDLLAELVIEIPTYQRKNLFVYDDSVIKSSSLSAEVTPYWGPMAEIWKVELNG